MPRLARYTVGAQDASADPHESGVLNTSKTHGTGRTGVRVMGQTRIVRAMRVERTQHTHTDTHTHTHTWAL